MNNKWILLIVCLLLSSGTWLIHNLSQSYVSIVSVQVQAESNIDGRAAISSATELITAQVKASGFRQAMLNSKSKRPVKVIFAADDFVYDSGNAFAIPSSQILKYSSAIFGNGVVVESVISQDPKFSFAPVSHKRVPVRKIDNLSFRPQYMATAPISFSPDSVTVYGDSSRIDHIDYVLTKPITLQDISTSLRDKVELDVPRGLRCSDYEVLYSLDVSRYVEISEEVKLETVNVPQNMQLSALPSKIKVVFRCRFPVEIDPIKYSTFYVDYREFVESINGRCMVRAEGITSSVIEYSITPEFVDCVLRSL